MDAPSLNRSLIHGWESTILNQPDADFATNMGAPGLDFETWESTKLNSAALYQVTTLVVPLRPKNE
jgi:hypothetical protein